MLISGDGWQLRNPKEKACMTDRAPGGAIDLSSAGTEQARPTLIWTPARRVEVLVGVVSFEV